MEAVTVRKLDHDGRQVTAYNGEVLRREDGAIVLRTTWEHPPLDLGFVVLETGGQWIEYFYADRWYNVFEIHAAGGHLLGWYCNVTRPARISDSGIAWEDLALDLWVAPDGETRVLDEDEFAALPLTPAERRAARAALAELQELAARKAPPFDGRDGSE
jgi:predicted RNA-binding protein associated with RNAse of E/G family